MERFKSIVAVVTEDSLFEVALTRAVALAKANGAALTLVDVIHAAPGELAKLMATLPGRRGPEIEDDVIAYHRDRLAGLADTARGEGIEVSEAILQGSSFVEVIRMVLREGHDIVIKGATVAADDRGVMKGFDMHLLGKCPCPVWMLVGPEDGGCDRVLAAVDPEPAGDAVRDKLDRLVLDLATSLGARDNARVDVIHCWFLPEERALRHGRYTKTFAGEVDVLLDREESDARARVSALMADYPQLPQDRVHVLKGNPGDVIADFAEREKSDLIVMGTVGRIGLSGFIMGNTAETILNRVQCSVIAVKPDGFVSPVTLDSVG
ncbi:MAG: universal stress protein [Pseudomonadota bacterium]